MIRFTFKNNSGRKTEDEDERERVEIGKPIRVTLSQSGFGISRICTRQEESCSVT